MLHLAGLKTKSITRYNVQELRRLIHIVLKTKIRVAVGIRHAALGMAPLPNKILARPGL